jgi:TatD DNase family protein
MQVYQQDSQEVLNRAFESGVDQIITVGIDYKSSHKALQLARDHAGVFSTVGCHPHNADTLAEKDLDSMTGLATDPHVVAWGEIGLDYYRNRASRKGQLAVFNKQLGIAADLDLPVIIHDREAHDDVLSCLESMGSGRLRGVIHCFSGDSDLAGKFIDLGFYISFPGTVTFPKAYAARNAAAQVPIDRLLVETDAPYLTPVPFRGKRNEPAFVKYTAGEIASLRHIDFEELAKRTSDNARRLFGLPEPQSLNTSE